MDDNGTSIIQTRLVVAKKSEFLDARGLNIPMIFLEDFGFYLPLTFLDDFASRVNVKSTPPDVRRKKPKLIQSRWTRDAEES